MASQQFIALSIQAMVAFQNSLRSPDEGTQIVSIPQGLLKISRSIFEFLYRYLAIPQILGFLHANDERLIGCLRKNMCAMNNRISFVE